MVIQKNLEIVLNKNAGYRVNQFDIDTKYVFI